MTTEEAIEILKTENKHPWNWPNSPLREAVKLAIEWGKAKLEAEKEYPL